jgi:hypothetical protein
MPTTSTRGSCGVVFAGVAAFDAHRLGSFWKPISRARGSSTRRRAAHIFHCTLAATRLDCYNQPVSACCGQGGSQGSGIDAQPTLVAGLEEVHAWAGGV